MGGGKIWSCRSCSHFSVCSKKADFEKAMKAVNDVTIIIGETENEITTKKISDFDFIFPVFLHCRYYQQDR